MMTLIYKRKIILLILFLSILQTSYTQDIGSILKNNVENNDIDFLIKLHKKQSEKLLIKRGIGQPDKRSLNEIGKSFLLKILNSYSNNVGVLIYVYNNGELISLLLNNKGDEFINKKKVLKKDLIENVNRYSEFHSSKQSTRGAIAVSNKHDANFINEIEQYLFPFKNEIIGLEHLIIIPALNISNIPFASIKVSETKYLIDYMSYSIAPSVIELQSSKNLNENRGFYSDEHVVSFFVENALFVSNPTFNDKSKKTFSALPGTEKEVLGITSSLEDSTYTILNGINAKFSNFYNNLCNYDLLYFATHGVSDNKDPLNNSYLALSMDDDSKSNLTAKDVQNIRNKCLLKAELVVLSACQTGLGEAHEAGTIGLTRAFHLAGSNHIVMSLWNVDDEKTAILMNLFFKYLKEPDKLMPHTAFRKAILEFKNEFKNPNYWSSFSIFGIPY